MSGCGGGGGGNGGGGGPVPAPLPVTTSPAITGQPQSQTVSDGQPASFDVAASGTAPLTYQWKRNGADILGATARQYSIGAASLADNGAQFHVVVANSAGSVTSGAALLNVNAVAPAIVTQPLAQSVLAGSTAAFSVAATGSQPLSYQWRRNGAAIPGAISSTYITPVNTPADSGAVFDVVISNSAGDVASSAVVLTVSVSITAPTITKQPVSASVPLGAAVAFSVGASGTAPFAYQWKRNDVDIPNETGEKLIVAPVSGINDQDSYTVRVSNAAGFTVSSAAILSVIAQSGQMDLLAGLLGGPGNVDGIGGNAHFRSPADVAADTSGNLFVADSGNGTVRKMTPAGVVSTIAGRPGAAGYVDGDGASARFNFIGSIAVDAAGNVFVLDGNSVRKIASTGAVTTLAGDPSEAGYADGSGTSARFNVSGLPLFFDRGQLAAAQNGDIYVGDCGNHVIRRVTQGGVVSTYAGTPNQAGSADGPVAAATFKCPTALAFDAQGNMYVADSGNHTLRKIAASDVTTLAGTASPFGNVRDGTGSAAAFQDVTDLAVDSAGNIFVGDSRQLRKVSPTGEVTTVAGTCCGSAVDGVGTAAGFSSLGGISVDGADNLYVADSSVHAIRRITPALVVTTFPSRLGQRDYQGYMDGPAGTALFNEPVAITADAAGNAYVADSFNCAIRRIAASGAVTTLVGEPAEGLGACSSNPEIDPLGISLDSDGSIYVSDNGRAAIYRVTPSGTVSVLAGSPTFHGFQDGVGGAARFWFPGGVATDGNGNVYVADANTIRKIVIATGAVTTLAGTPFIAGSADGTGPSARFGGLCGIEADRAGNVYVADCDNHTLRKVTPSGVVTTLAGTAAIAGYIDGDISAALFNVPADVALDDNGNLYVVDQGNLLIRKITPAGAVSTVAGIKGLEGQAVGPLPASLGIPVGIHARTLSGGTVELLLTIENGVARILPD